MICLELDSQNPLRAHIQFSHSPNIHRQFPRWGLTSPIKLYMTIHNSPTWIHEQNGQGQCVLLQTLCLNLAMRKEHRQTDALHVANLTQIAKSTLKNAQNVNFQLWLMNPFRFEQFGLVWPRTCTWRFSHEALEVLHTSEFHLQQCNPTLPAL